MQEAVLKIWQYLIHTLECQEQVYISVCSYFFVTYMTYL